MPDRRDYYSLTPTEGSADKWRSLPVVDPNELKQPAGYQPSPGLVAAVNVALELGMPLLLTGEPGCGKSELARSLGWQLGLLQNANGSGLAQPLRYVVKSDTESRDLFYRFDALGRFHAAQSKEVDADADARRFITYHALGKAILRAKGQQGISRELMPDPGRHNIPVEPQRSVVLIDEIDKAPREVPNDILTEIDDLSFTIPELFHLYDQPIRLETEDQRFRPIVIITSNGERELPQAFLRRCVYFHVTLPPFLDEKPAQDPESVTIEKIVEGRLGDKFKQKPRLLADALSFFKHIRKRPGLKKLPSLGELLNWLNLLSKYPGPGDTPLSKHPQFQMSATTLLLKHQPDQQQIEDIVRTWQAAQSP